MTGGRTPPRSRLCSRSPNSTATSCRAPSRTRQGAWRSSRRIGGLCCCSPTCSCSPAERPTLPRGSVGRSAGEQEHVGEQQHSPPIRRLERHAPCRVLDGALQLVAVELGEREQRRERGGVRPPVMQLLQEALAA